MSEKAVTKKILQGVVVSTAMEKSIVVLINFQKKDKRFKKIIRQSRKVTAHDEKKEAGKGDIVILEETRPLSKNKRHILKTIVQKGVAVGG